MPKRKKLTKNQEVFKKEITRIRNFIRRAEKRGYYFLEDIIPKMPKRVTLQAIKKIKNMTANTLYKKSVKVNIETGEYISGEIAQKNIRKEAAKKGAITRKNNRLKKKNESKYLPNFTNIIISQFRNHISQLNVEARDMLDQWLNDLIYDKGEDAVAEMLEKAANDGLLITFQVVYKRDSILQYMSEMLSYLPEIDNKFKSDFMDAIEIMEDWDDIL